VNTLKYKPPPNASKPSPISRRALRAKIERASIRPAPGTSELLSRSMSTEETVSTVHRGRSVVLYDLVDLAPVHLFGSSVDRRKK
jgi:hypothetical protein